MKEIENNINNKFLLCECMSEGILLTNNREDKVVYVNLFQHANVKIKTSLLERLKYAWRHIRIGEKQHNHEIILNYDNVKELRKWLNDNTTEEAWKDSFNKNVRDWLNGK